MRLGISVNINMKHYSIEQVDFREYINVWWNILINIAGVLSEIGVEVKNET